MKLCAVYRSEQINAFYRAFLPMVTMRERGHEIVEVLQERGTPLPLDRLGSCDFVHIHRLVLDDDHPDDDCVARLQDRGVAVGFDDDDNSEAAPPELEGIVAEGSLERAKTDFERLLARAPQIDLFTTPSPDLAARFEAAGADNVRVIDNYLPGAFHRVKPNGHDGIVIGWHAAEEHLLDVEALGLRETLVRVLDADPGVELVTVGIDLRLDHERYRREEGVPIAELTQRLADFDIGLAPLADTPFNRARSNVKAREYAAAGVPWLASPVGAYRELGKDQGGQLVGDGDWQAALEDLIRSGRERARLQRRGRKWAERETIWKMAEVWEQAFADTIADVRAAA